MPQNDTYKCATPTPTPTPDGDTRHGGCSPWEWDVSMQWEQQVQETAMLYANS